MSNSTQIETLHDVIIGKNGLIKLLQETIENLDAQLMDWSTLKPIDTDRNQYTRNGNIRSWQLKKLLSSLQDYHCTKNEVFH